jgi:hypothetical protein
MASQQAELRIIDLRRLINSIYPGNIVRPTRWGLFSKVLFVVTVLYMPAVPRGALGRQ